MSSNFSILPWFQNRQAKLLALCIIALTSTNAQALTGQAGWLEIKTDIKRFTMFYDPLSIQEQAPGTKRIHTLLNYKNKAGEESSMISETVYRCTAEQKQDRYIFIFKGHWAKGEPVNAAGAENDWHQVLPNTAGEWVMKVACLDI